MSEPDISELDSLPGRTFVPTSQLEALFGGNPPIDRDQFFADIDRFLDQDSFRERSTGSLGA